MKITICLGSSCHARGNRVLVENLKARLAARGVEAEFELQGSLCLGHCAEGPMVLIDGEPLIGGHQDLGTLLEERLFGPTQ